jgi:glycosyltransferase involved in cell wall biosynthesis
MACGKPVIASNTSGHRDVLTAENALRIEELTPAPFFQGDEPVATWDDPGLDETIAKLEFAYEHRGQLQSIGEQAGRDMQRFTWRQTAECFQKLFQEVGTDEPPDAETKRPRRSSASRGAEPIRP